MSLKDLICCLALIYYGTTKERMQREKFHSIAFFHFRFPRLFFLVLYLLFAYNVANSNGVLHWHDVEDFLSQCGDHPPEELNTLFQNVIQMEYFRINNAFFHSSSVMKSLLKKGFFPG